MIACLDCLEIYNSEQPECPGCGSKFVVTLLKRDRRQFLDALELAESAELDELLGKLDLPRDLF